MNSVQTQELLCCLIGFRIQKVKILDGLPHLMVFELRDHERGSVQGVWNIKKSQLAFCKKGALSFQSMPRPTQSLHTLRKIFAGKVIHELRKKGSTYLFCFGDRSHYGVLETKPKFHFTSVDHVSIGEFEVCEAPSPIPYDVEKIQSWISLEQEQRSVESKLKKKYQRRLANIQQDIDKNAKFESLFQEAHEAQAGGSFKKAEQLFAKAKKLKRKYLGAIERLNLEKNRQPSELTLPQNALIAGGQAEEKKRFPVPYVERDQAFILWGRTAKENDELSLKIASPNDWWLHTREGTSAHVIIKMKDKKKSPSLELLLDGGEICAKNSEQRAAGKVEVMYTQAKFLRKPKGMAPGKVLFTREKSLIVKLN